MTEHPTVLIYGAYGYTGQLVLREAISRGLTPIVSGRNRERVKAVAAAHGLIGRPFELADAAAHLDDVDTVLHCAGPFLDTYRPILDACLMTGTNYLDLTGEVEVFEGVYAQHDAAVAANVVLIPGVGFDIVPTDHLVARLNDLVRGAIGADIAVISRGGFSPGTLRTAAAGLGIGNRVRSGGALTPVGHAHRILTLDDLDPQHPPRVATTPLGDISSAYHGYGLTELATFTTVPLPGLVQRLSTPLQALMANPVGVRATNRIIDRIPGPRETTRTATRSSGWARVYDAAGHGLTLAVDVTNTYTFTAQSAVHAAITLQSSNPAPGAHTPATALGIDFLTSIPGAAVAFRQRQPKPAHVPAQRP
nr:saccharopine dehydrogenase NADP-binding domain-containing protein [Gordonia sp. LAM0048]